MKTKFKIWLGNLLKRLSNLLLGLKCTDRHIVIERIERPIVTFQQELILRECGMDNEVIITRQLTEYIGKSGIIKITKEFTGVVSEYKYRATIEVLKPKE